MSAVKNAFHDEISNRCETCGVMLTEQDTAPCDAPLCPIPMDAVLKPFAEVASIFDRAIARVRTEP